MSRDSFFQNITSKYDEHGSSSPTMKNILHQSSSLGSSKRVKTSSVEEYQENGVAALTPPDEVYDVYDQSLVDEPQSSDFYDPPPPAGLLFPPVYYDGSPEYFVADDSWMTHSSWQWMYCLTDGSYYHVESNTFYCYDASTFHFYKIAVDETAPVDAEESPAPVEDGYGQEEYAENEYQYGEGGEGGEEVEEEEEEVSEEEGFFFLDFEKDISVSTADIMVCLTLFMLFKTYCMFLALSLETHLYAFFHTILSVFGCNTPIHAIILSD